MRHTFQAFFLFALLLLAACSQPDKDQQAVRTELCELAYALKIELKGEWV